MPRLLGPTSRLPRYLSYLFSTNHGKEWQSGYTEDLNEDCNFKVLSTSDTYEPIKDGSNDDRRAKAFARVLGVRDGTSRKATLDEQTVVAMHLYFYLCNMYEGGQKVGFWKIWHEEHAFPDGECAFHNYSSHIIAGVFE